MILKSLSIGIIGKKNIFRIYRRGIDQKLKNEFTMNDQTTVFTPLRITLIITIMLSNLLAVVSFVFKTQAWAEPLGIFAVVFIMLFVFVILLEIVWLHHRGKTTTDAVIMKRYQLAKLIYAVLFVVGFLIAYWVLME